MGARLARFERATCGFIDAQGLKEALIKQNNRTHDFNSIMDEVQAQQTTVSQPRIEFSCATFVPHWGPSMGNSRQAQAKLTVLWLEV
jgi:hypothetical protein